jgi:hypothetical protein
MQEKERFFEEAELFRSEKIPLLNKENFFYGPTDPSSRLSAIYYWFYSQLKSFKRRKCKVLSFLYILERSLDAISCAIPILIILFINSVKAFYYFYSSYFSFFFIIS